MALHAKIHRNIPTYIHAYIHTCTRTHRRSQNKFRGEALIFRGFALNLVVFSNSGRLL